MSCTNHLSPLAGCSHLFQPEPDELQHARELTEHNGLGTGVSSAHEVKLLTQRLDLGAALETGPAACACVRARQQEHWESGADPEGMIVLP